jgi:signal transduction histidine kinase
LSGPLGAINVQLSDHAEAVTAEAISNAVRHSGAKHITVTATVGDDFSLEVTDDGHGIPADNQRNSGLANMSRRAELLGGTCEITSTREGGTTVQWTVPVFTE